MFELMIGIDAVQRRSGRSFGAHRRPAPKRRVAAVRLSAAAILRALADRIEPLGAGRTPEPAGVRPR
jgi:hypothetical protein